MIGARGRLGVLFQVFAIVLALAMCSRVYAQVLPSAPLDPTADECRDLSAHYSSVLTDLHSQMRSCMKEEPSFGQPGWRTLPSPGATG
jgi:hypothetical protein